jgi:glycosyltransferase involved in cell wall biosynthesis
MFYNIDSRANIIDSTPFFNVVDEHLGDLIRKKDLLKIMKKLWLVFLMKTGLISLKIKNERKKMNLKNYDAEIAYKEGFCTVFVANGNSKSKINWIHLDYKVKNYSKNYEKLLKRELGKIDYNVAVSLTAAESYKEVFDINSDVYAINNIIDEEGLIKKSKDVISLPYDENKFTFVSMGRLHEQKAFHRLIKIASELRKDNYSFEIFILGEGELRNEYENLINELDISDSVHLLGNKENPFPYLLNADCFVLSSKYEGAPTVVYESLLLKLPVITTEVSGVKEQLKTNEYGVITDNSTESLLDGMRLVLDDTRILEQVKNALQNYEGTNQKTFNEFDMLIRGEVNEIRKTN